MEYMCTHPHPFELPCISRMDKKEKTLATKYSSKTKRKKKEMHRSESCFLR